MLPSCLARWAHDRNNPFQLEGESWKILLFIGQKESDNCVSEIFSTILDTLNLNNLHLVISF